MFLIILPFSFERARADEKKPICSVIVVRETESKVKGFTSTLSIYLRFEPETTMVNIRLVSVYIPASL